MFAFGYGLFQILVTVRKYATSFFDAIYMVKLNKTHFRTAKNRNLFLENNMCSCESLQRLPQTMQRKHNYCNCNYFKYKLRARVIILRRI